MTGRRGVGRPALGATAASILVLALSGCLVDPFDDDGGMCRSEREGLDFIVGHVRTEDHSVWSRLRCDVDGATIGEFGFRVVVSDESYVFHPDTSRMEDGRPATAHRATADDGAAVEMSFGGWYEPSETDEDRPRDAPTEAHYLIAYHQDDDAVPDLPPAGRLDLDVWRRDAPAHMVRLHYQLHEDGSHELIDMAYHEGQDVGTDPASGRETPARPDA